MPEGVLVHKLNISAVARGFIRCVDSFSERAFLVTVFVDRC